MKYDARVCKFNMDTRCVELLLRDERINSTHPVSMLNEQALSSYFMFVSFLPYSTFTVVTFVIRSFF